MSFRRLVPLTLVILAGGVIHGLLGPPGDTLDSPPLSRANRVDPARCDAAPLRTPPRLIGRSAQENGTWGPAPAGRRRTRSELRGRVLAVDGRAVADVRVRLHRAGGRPVRTGPTDEEGRYRHVTREVGPYRASLELDGVGAGAAGPVEVGGEGTFELPDLVLRGRGLVAGRVTFPDGTPAGFVSVRARSDAPGHDSRGSSALPGLVSSGAWTDADGRFRIGGLRPGPLVVEAPTCNDRRTVVRVACGTEDVELVLDFHRTRVQVVDPQGRAISGADIGIRYVREGRCPMGRAPVRPADGSRNFWWDPGTHVIVAGHLDAHTVAEEEIVVAERPWSRTVDLVLEPHGPGTGSLRVHLTDDLGQRITRLTLVLTSPLARSRLDRGANHHPDDEGVVPDLAPGTFHVSVHPDGEDGLRTAAYCFPVQRQITIRPHTETRLDLRTRTGGRLRMNERCAAAAEREDLAAYVRFERAGAPEERPLWLDPHDDDVSMLLEPGLWTMVVYGEHVREERRAVLVEAGVTRDEGITLLPLRSTRAAVAVSSRRGDRR